MNSLPDPSVTVSYYNTLDIAYAACPVSCCACVTLQDAPETEWRRRFPHRYDIDSADFGAADRFLDQKIDEKVLFYSHRFLSPQELKHNPYRTLRKTMDSLVSEALLKARQYRDSVEILSHRGITSFLYSSVKPKKVKWGHWCCRTIAHQKRSWMMRHHWARQYPEYGWEQNQGLLTLDHAFGLLEHGTCPLHFEAEALKATLVWYRALAEADVRTATRPQPLRSEAEESILWWNRYGGRTLLSAMDPFVREKIRRMTEGRHPPEFESYWLGENNPFDIPDLAEELEDV
jgi:ribonuclease HII